MIVMVVVVVMMTPYEYRATIVNPMYDGSGYVRGRVASYYCTGLWG
jgi:hypothetical protein